MNFNLKNIATASALSLAMIGTTLVTTAPAQATHKIGHAIVGGVIGGIIGGAIVNGVNRRRQPVYVAPAPVYVQPAPVYVRPAPQPVYRAFPAQHYNWCFRKFRSYDQGSNTYQPYGNYGRQACRSPWG